MDFKKEVIEYEGKVVVDFYADWCGPCRMMSPVIDGLKNERSDIKVLKVNVDNEEKIAREYGVMSIPTIIVFENGNIKEKVVGVVSREELLGVINK